MVDRFKPSDPIQGARPDVQPPEQKTPTRGPGPVDSFEGPSSKATMQSQVAGQREAAKLLPKLSINDLGGAEPFLSQLDPQTGERSMPSSKKFFENLVTHADKPEVQAWLKAPERENLKSAVKQHAIEKATDQLINARDSLQLDKVPTQLKGKIKDKKELLSFLVNAYGTMPDLRPALKKAVPQITDILDRLNKLKSIS